MSNKGLASLLAAAIIAVIAAVFLSEGAAGPAADPLAGRKVMPEFAQRVDSVGHITLVRGGVKTSFIRKGNGWTVEEKSGYPADNAKVQQMVLGLADLTYVEPKTRKPDLYSRLELEDPSKKGAKSTLVTASDSKGSLLGEIIAGKRKVDELGGGNDGVYVRTPGDAQTWLARGTLDLSGETADWLDKKLLDLPADAVKSVTLKQPDGAALTFARAKAGAPFALEGTVPAGKKLKADALSDPAGALADLELSDVKPSAGVVLPKQANTARYQALDGLVIEVTLFKENGTEWARIAASGIGTAAKRADALEAKLAPWLFALPSYKVKAMETKLDDVLEAPKAS